MQKKPELQNTQTNFKHNNEKNKLTNKIQIKNLTKLGNKLQNVLVNKATKLARFVITCFVLTCQ